MRKNKNILIIDDEKDFCYFVKKNLELFAGYNVVTATLGTKGIRAALKEKPNLILLDIMMPGIDGFEVLEKLKKNKKTLHIPVIMLTSKSEDESKMKAVGLYCDDYIVKPVEFEVLISKIDKVLSRTKF